MGSRRSIDPVPPPEPPRRSAAGVASWLGRGLLRLVLTVLHNLLVALFVILIMLGRLALALGRLLFWRGLLTIVRAHSIIRHLINGKSEWRQGQSLTTRRPGD